MDVLEKFKENQKAGWAFFAPLQTFTTVPAARLVEHAAIRSGMRVLDVACGTGVVSVTARMGARVTGLDLTPELRDVARTTARIAALDIEWHEGDVEQLRSSRMRSTWWSASSVTCSHRGQRSRCQRCSAC
ncbi:MAG TPA: methyltransferase domain-containing protein [Vicinamibacterales bacterium]|nr:methyltransferase domain-containing protein [Vicinamibacterales bacterium]